MPNGLFIRLPAVTEYPSSEVSEIVRQKAKLYQNQVPILPLLVIPKTTLKMLASHAKLDEKLDSLLKRPLLKDNSSVATVKRAVISAFKKIKIPENFKASFIGEYYNYLGGGFVTISTSGGNNSARSENATGDASVFESFLDVWAENFFFLYQYAPKNIPKLQLLSEHPILIEKAIQASASGIAYTLNPTTLEKNTLAIYSTWGNFTSEQSQPLDSFLVDLRSLESTQTQIVPKPVQLKLTADNFLQVNTPKRQLMIPSLDAEQLRQLAILILKIKKQSIDHLEIHWLYENYHFYIKEIKPIDLFSIPEEYKIRAEKHRHTITKLYVSTGNPDRADDHLTNHVDGVGIFRSEYVVAKLGFHPNFVIKSKYKKVLEQEFATAITSYQTRLQGKPFLFRSLNMTSSELLKLQYGNQYENHEEDSYLGFRGGMRLLTNLDWFEFELKILNASLKKYRSPIGYVLPFVRTPSELSQIQNKIDSARLSDFAHFQTFWQVNTPSNLISLRNYPLSRISGIIINIKSVHGLLMGINPDNKELIGRYPLDYDVLAPVLSNAIKMARQNFANLQVLIHMEDYQATLAKLVIDEGAHGLIVKPGVASRVKADIIDIEQAPLRKI